MRRQRRRFSPRDWSWSCTCTRQVCTARHGTFASTASLKLSVTQVRIMHCIAIARRRPRIHLRTVRRPTPTNTRPICARTRQRGPAAPYEPRPQGRRTTVRTKLELEVQPRAPPSLSTGLPGPSDATRNLSRPLPPRSREKGTHLAPSPPTPPSVPRRANAHPGPG
ncbi:hypothetical protein BC628DRAFT_734584 [Trametes gibbosa]|nr:hypothetical protein BC628DRAFT_734584 [Trametes gibbosa]